MPRLPVLVVLLLAMVWQAVAMARIGSAVNVLADPAHAALHWQAQSHHHHDDGSYHAGDSADAVQHLLSDHAGAITALWLAGTGGVPPMGSAPPFADAPARVPHPVLDGLLRPPRARA